MSQAEEPTYKMFQRAIVLLSSTEPKPIKLVVVSHATTGEVVKTVSMSTTSVDEEQMTNSNTEADLTNTQEEISRQV